MNNLKQLSLALIALLSTAPLCAHYKYKMSPDEEKALQERKALQEKWNQAGHTSFYSGTPPRPTEETFYSRHIFASSEENRQAVRMALLVQTAISGQQELQGYYRFQGTHCSIQMPKIEDVD